VSDEKKRGKNVEPNLSGTTLRVYRYLYRSGKALGVREIQRGISLSSPSVAEYHVKKLLEMNLIKEDVAGSSRFVVDRVIFENMIRVKKLLIPFQVAYAIFFGIALVLLVSLFRPEMLSSQYVFSVIIIGAACIVFAYQTFSSLRRSTV
jgi:DNA-binding transcriptional ArsR family regulator